MTIFWATCILSRNSAERIFFQRISSHSHSRFTLFARAKLSELDIRCKSRLVWTSPLNPRPSPGATPATGLHKTWVSSQSTSVFLMATRRPLFFVFDPPKVTGVMSILSLGVGWCLDMRPCGWSTAQDADPSLLTIFFAALRVACHRAFLPSRWGHGQPCEK